MNNEPLHQKHCIPCEGGTPPLDSSKTSLYIEQVNQWELNGDTSIQKLFILKDFKEALTLVNTIGNIAETENHHPDICIFGWNKVRVTLSTHAIKGLSENDFILASKIDEYIRNNS